MNTSSFLQALRSHPALPLVFRSGGTTLAPGYHLTEVKRVAYDTMDCGAQTHRWSETQFEVWVPAGAAAAHDRGHMPAGKFLRIVDRVERELPLHLDAPARIHASLGQGPAALYDVHSVTARDEQLVVDLVPDRTRCKAAERQLAAGGAACCGPDAAPPADEAGCGCGAKQPAENALACCA